MSSSFIPLPTTHVAKKI